MKIRLLLIFALVLPLHIFAQNGTIKGVIAGTTDDEKIAYASVTLMKSADTSLIKGVASELDGSFAINNIANGDYIIQVYFAGYSRWFSPRVSITREKNIVDLDTVRLTMAANMLSVAEIVVSKPLFEMKHGTMTMNVEADPTATGDNLLELLRKMPSVLVDHEDNVSIEGKSGVTILIDDKPTNLSGDDLNALLKSMSTDMVERIEVMKNPSARYDAEGTGGIINIVTKKEKRLGINGSVNASIGYSKSLKHNEGINLNARSGKLYLTASYSFNNYKSSSSYTGSNQYYRFGDTVFYTTNEMRDELWGSRSLWKAHNFSFGADYAIDKKNSIGISYRGNTSNWSSDGNSTRRIYTNHVLDSSYIDTRESINKSLNQTVNLNYKHSFDSAGKDLFLDVLYSNNSGERNSINELAYYWGESSENIYRKEKLKNITDPTTINVFTVKADYEHPFNDHLKLDVGIKTGFVKNDNNSSSYRDDVIREELLNHFIYKESISAAYAQFSATIKKNLDIRAGLRAEYTWLEGTLATTKESNPQHYTKLFPSFSVGYRLPKNNSLDFSYRHSIYRPGYYNLNPFINTSDPYNWNTGNPNLRPQYAHNLSLNYSWNYKINFWMGYGYVKDSYTNMTFTDPETGVRISLPENIGESHSGNAGLSARFNVGKWWNMNYYLGGNYGRQIFNYEKEVVTKNVFSNWFNFTQSFTFLKNYTFDISGYGSLPSEGTFGRNAGRININAGLKANLLKRTLTLRLSINDIFNNGIWKSDYIYPDGSTSVSESRWESRSLWLSASYRFGKQDIQPRNRRVNNNEELERIGNGGNNGEGGA